jgi:hypothetical protein
MILGAGCIAGEGGCRKNTTPGPRAWGIEIGLDGPRASWPSLSGIARYMVCRGGARCGKNSWIIRKQENMNERLKTNTDLEVADEDSEICAFAHCMKRTSHRFPS